MLAACTAHSRSVTFLFFSVCSTCMPVNNGKRIGQGSAVAAQWWLGLGYLNSSTMDTYSLTVGLAQGNWSLSTNQTATIGLRDPITWSAGD